MDSSFAYGTHFALSVLVLPVHPIKISEYQLRLSLLRQHTRIALADVPAIPPPGLETSTGQPSYIVPTLLPTPTSRGNINLEFVETWDKELRWLEEFQIHRRVVAVIGIVDCSEWHNELKDAVAAFAELALEQAPPDVFVRRCYGFNPGEAQTDNAEGLVLVPTVGDPAFYVHTLLAEVCSGLLAGLSGVVCEQTRSLSTTLLISRHALEDGFLRFQAGFQRANPGRTLYAGSAYNKLLCS